MKAVEDRVTHGVHGNRGHRHCAQQALAGHGCRRKHHGESEAELAEVKHQVLVVRREQRDPWMPV